MKALFQMALALLLALVARISLGSELTMEQFKAERDFASISKAEGWTFEYDVTQIGRHEKGYFPPEGPVKVVAIPSAGPMKSFDLSQFGKPLTRVLNQGSCGSCVVFSIIANFMDALRLRGMDIPDLSPQHLMNCGTGGQCRGAYGEGIAEDLVGLKNLYAESAYPYTASSGSCKSKQAPRFGQIESYKTIDGSVRSILAALHNGQPVSVGIAADSRFSSYKSGVYNGCSSMSTNHYVVVQGVDCGTSVDVDGNCVFDERGNLPNGVGTFNVRNSWGNWGDAGYIKMLITNSSGKRCNNVAGGNGNAQILEIGIPMPDEKPKTFKIETDDVILDATVLPGAKFTVDQAKAALGAAMQAAEDK